MGEQSWTWGGEHINVKRVFFFLTIIIRLTWRDLNGEWKSPSDTTGEMQVVLQGPKNLGEKTRESDWWTDQFIRVDLFSTLRWYFSLLGFPCFLFLVASCSIIIEESTLSKYVYWWFSISEVCRTLIFLSHRITDFSYLHGSWFFSEREFVWLLRNERIRRQKGIWKLATVFSLICGKIPEFHLFSYIFLATKGAVVVGHW